MQANLSTNLGGEDLSDRERQVLEAVIRTYVNTAEPAGSRTVARDFHMGVSPATVRNTMSDLEAKGYLSHPHTSAGRIPTDLAYRLYVDRIMEPATLSIEQRSQLEQELDAEQFSAVDRLVRRATRALSLLSGELGLAIAPRLEGTVLDKLELVQVSFSKVLMVVTLRSGLVRTVYVDLPGDVPQDTLVTLTVILNERLAGLTLKTIRETVSERLRDVGPDVDPAAEGLMNIFMQSGSELFSWPVPPGPNVHLGQTSVLAAQPEFTTTERLKALIELTEKHDLLAGALHERVHNEGLHITIGGENDREELSDFTLVTAQYRVGGLKGVIGVIGPTRMPYNRVIAIVDYTSSLINRILET